MWTTQGEVKTSTATEEFVLLSLPAYAVKQALLAARLVSQYDILAH